jgi:Mlc titration factor MtfA (ptsG expression regulator)
MALLIVCGLALALIAGLLALPLLRERRRARLARQPFPQAWRTVLRRRVPLVARLPADLQLRLKQLMLIFLAEKPIIGCAGLQVSDEMRVTIAAQACLPLLGDARGFYPRLRQVLLYPGAFVVDRLAQGAGGVQREERRLLSGESWSQGQVVLSWQDVLEGAADPGDGRNVVIHEFAHQLDQVKGHADGAPPQRDAQARRRWSTVMQAEFQALQARSARGEPGLLSDYGATEPAEFFAVASEVFFEQPLQLAAAHPALYRELAAFYKVHPFSW